jgi:hypothetical protein
LVSFRNVNIHLLLTTKTNQMKKLINFSVKCLCICALSIVLIACSEDDNTTSVQAINCNVDVADCLTDSNLQAYVPVSHDGTVFTFDCALSIRIGFNASGSFTWNSNTDMDCLELTGIEPFVGNWTLENNNTEIHITPPLIAEHGQATILTIVSLNELELEVRQAGIIVGEGPEVWVYKRI